MEGKDNSAFYQELSHVCVCVCACVCVCVCRKDALNEEESKWEMIFKEKTQTTEPGLEGAEC